MDAPRHAVSLSPAQQMGVEAGKLREEPFICHRVSFATLNHVIIKFRPARTPLPRLPAGRGVTHMYASIGCSSATMQTQ